MSISYSAIMRSSIQLAGQAIVMAERAFSDRLHDVDITNMVTQMTAETNVFYGHFFDSFDRSSSNIEPLVVQLAVLQGMRDRGEI